MAVKTKDKKDISVHEKLAALYRLQVIDSEIDRIRTVRGELPLEVQDLEDEIEGLETRLTKMEDEIKDLKDKIAEKKNLMTEAEALIKKYQEQTKNVRNNREFDSLNKEIEFQQLEIQLAEKRIKEYKAGIDAKAEVLEENKKALEERKSDLEHKNSELAEITSETEKDESALVAKSNKALDTIEERLQNAYKRIRDNARNGLAVVAVQRDACGGCFNKIPPQRQLDIRMHKKIIVCEHCGRILVDDELKTEVEESM